MKIVEIKVMLCYFKIGESNKKEEYIEKKVTDTFPFGHGSHSDV